MERKETEKLEKTKVESWDREGEARAVAVYPTDRSATMRLFFQLVSVVCYPRFGSWLAVP